MIAASSWPRARPSDDRLLCVDPARDRFTDSRVGALAEWLERGDLVVVNDAATLPASLRALRADGTPFEVRLLSRGPDEGTSPTRWRAVLFGRGDWRVRTEDRPAPPRLAPGERIRVAGGASARVASVDRRSPRLVHVEFDGAAASMWRSIYDEGRPVQYAYLSAPLALGDVQSPFASRPWAVELPSAGRPLTSVVLAGLRRRGIGVVALTHAAGLSSSGEPELDALLPLDERYDLPPATVRAIGERRAAGGRIIAVGTTVVRALEGCAAANDGALVAGEGSTALRLHARSRLRIADGLVTGIHERGTTHYDLMQSFVTTARGVVHPDIARHDVLDRALAHAEGAGYLQHEFGDSLLLLPSR